ncbi:MalY/PatB family protein [Facklamia lactis]|uniref:MalY/PatB family protein n=1 Tax=Facklamia lactis TaxID=2749967 RepID=UPI0018CD999D|nr:MalY/PatB family protein [Facklamia lactis]MBG9981082.1 pyridoxal phosphate-dependent aminotransferase [Facklamia lactis]
MNFDKVIDRRGSYCTQWDYVEDRFGQSGLLPFTISDTDFALPDMVLSALHERVEHGVFGYTRWNHDDFKGSVASWFERRFSTDIDSNWVVYSPSVMYAVSQLIRLKSERGQGVVVQTPAYDAFYKTIQQNQRQVIENPLLFDESGYTIDFEHLETVLSQPENVILLFCSPHNPSGRVWTPEELEKVVRLCEKYQVFMISDEIHMDVIRSKFHHIPVCQYSQKNVALLSSGSKTFNFAGLLFAYAMIPDAELHAAFLKQLKQADGLSSPSALGMIATMQAYHDCEEWVDQLNFYIEKNDQYVCAFLEEHCPKLKVIKSQSTYLMWIDIRPTGVTMDTLQSYLVKEGKVAIMDGKVYGGNGHHFLRLNIGCPRSKLAEGLQRLAKVYQILVEK